MTYGTTAGILGDGVELAGSYNSGSGDYARMHCTFCNPPETG